MFLAKKYTKKHEVSYYECDINQTMTFPSMLGVVIKTSEDQSDQLGRGSEFVNSFDLLGSSRIIPWRLIVSLESVK